MFGYLGYVKYATNPSHAEFIPNPEERAIKEEALLADETAAPFYYTALAGLGRQLTDWGERLQDRYENGIELSQN